MKNNFLDLLKSDDSFFIIEEENQNKKYDGLLISIFGIAMRYRTSKITPTKNGQFVAIWQRDNNKLSIPYQKDDKIKYHLIFSQKDSQQGVFIFSQDILVDKNIISSNRIGKRAFRVYPSWDVCISKQAINTQKWQLNYFYLLNDLNINTLKTIII